MTNKSLVYMLVLLLLVLVAVSITGCAEPVTDPEEPVEPVEPINDVIKVGAPIPQTGPYASDGEQMEMALVLAIAEMNEAGGLLGRPLELFVGDVGALEAEKIRAVGERLGGEGIDVAITGYANFGVDSRTFGQFDMPYLHGNAATASTEVVAENLEEFGNVFQYCPSEVSYGYDTAMHLFDIAEKIGWEPPNNKVAAISVDYSYNIYASEVFLEQAEEQGYEVVMNDIVDFGIVEWGPFLSRIADAEPAFITVWILAPDDCARFITQFSERFGEDGYDGLIYFQYTPNIPEFLELAGENAEGVIWSTSIGVIGEDADDYARRWEEFFGEEPKATYAYSVRDAFDIWVAAVEQAGCVDCYDEVVENIRNISFQGMSGVFRFAPEDQQALYGDDLIPTLWYQVQDGRHVLTWPEMYKETEFITPPWIK